MSRLATVDPTNVNGVVIVLVENTALIDVVIININVHRVGTVAILIVVELPASVPAIDIRSDPGNGASDGFIEANGGVMVADILKNGVMPLLLNISIVLPAVGKSKSMTIVVSNGAVTVFNKTLGKLVGVTGMTPPTLV